MFTKEQTYIYICINIYIYIYKNKLPIGSSLLAIPYWLFSIGYSLLATKKKKRKDELHFGFWL